MQGKRPTPDGLTDQIPDLYGLGTEMRAKLAGAADKTIQNIKVSLNKATDPQRDAALCFVHSFDDLDDETAKSVLELLHKKRDA